MTDIATNLSTIDGSLSDIKTAIVAKGVTPSGNITPYATAIEQISGGGGSPIIININDVDITSYDSDPTTGASFWKDLISEVVIYPTISGHCLAYIKDNNGDIITEYNRMGAYSIGSVGVSASSLYTSNSSFQVAISYVNHETFTGFVISPKTN